MKSTVLAALLILISSVESRIEAQIYDTNNVVVQTFAGSAFYGYLDGVGQQTMFNNPAALVADTSSNLFVLDIGNKRVRKITPDATVSTFVGGGNLATGYGTNASIDYGGTYSSIAIDHSNALWIPTYGGTLLRIGEDAHVSTIFLDGVTRLSGVCVDSGNNIYISDMGGNKIYRYRTNAVLEVFAGSGNPGSADGNWVFSSFQEPSALASDAADNIYVWDSANYLVRRIDPLRNVVTLAGHPSPGLNVDGFGTNASFYQGVYAMCVDYSGNLILACGSSIRKMTASTNVSTLAGNFTQPAYTNGVGNLARFNAAKGVCFSQGTIFVADSQNFRIRQITFDPAEQSVLPANLQLGTYPGLQIFGTVGRTYRIESSPDMNAWSTSATLLLTRSPYLWIDQNAVLGNKFYRAFLLP